MKRFELPKMEISKFSVEDVITTSAGEPSQQINTLTPGASGAAGKDILSENVSTYSINFTEINMGA